MTKLAIALAQLNAHVGHVADNLKNFINARARAAHLALM